VEEKKEVEKERAVVEVESPNAWTVIISFKKSLKEKTKTERHLLNEIAITMQKIYIITTILLNAIFGSAQCDILQSTSDPCANSSVFFSVDNPSGSYAWDFTDDGNIDAFGTSVSYSFPESNIDVSYPITLYRNGVGCNAINVMVQGIPDPSIGVIPGSGTLEDDLIRVCSSNPNVNLIIYNVSGTYSSNQSYEINWGDGTSESFDNTTFSNSSTISHDYYTYGYYNITITVEGANGCSNSNQYTLYNGSNPSVGLANPGNTVGLCVPATIDFPITNTSNNPTGTIYTVYINGEAVAIYNQENVASVFSYTFLEPSCGLTTSTGNYQNAYDVNIEASNPCGSSQATIEPIELSEPPEPIFTADEPNLGCEGEPITFTNASDDEGEVIAGDCSTLMPSWVITPGVLGVHWEIISGNTFASEEIEVVFLIPGTYTITMIVNSSSCGEFDFSQVFEIFENVGVNAEGGLLTAAAPAISDDCLPTVGVFTNLSTGDSLEYTWGVSPSSGWEFIAPFHENSTDLQINFTEPGSYNVSLSAGGYCGDAGWDTILVVADIPEAIISSIPNQCETATLNFDEDNVEINANYGILSNIEWAFPGATPASSNETYPTNIYYDSPGTYNISVTLTNQCGTSTSATATFTIEEPGQATVGDNINVCEVTAPFILVGNPTGGTWTGNGVTENGLFTPSQNTLGDNTLHYDVQDGACLLEDSLIITVTPAPVVVLPNEQSLCLTEGAYDLSAATPMGGTWSGSGISGNTFDPGLAGVGTHSVTYSYFDNLSGCSNSGTMEMEVLALPELITNDTVYCNTFGLVDLPFAQPAGGNWSGTGVVGNSFDPFLAGGVGTFNITYTYTDGNGCSNSEIAVISIISPDNVNAGDDFELCINMEPIDLSQVASPGGGSWNANGSLGLNGNTFDPALAGVGTHTLTYIIGTGNCQVMDDLEITVHPRPVVTAMNDFEICLNADPVSLIANPAGGNWTATNGAILVGAVFDPETSGEGVFSFSYSYTDGNGCENTDELVVTVLGIPNIITTNSTFCDVPGLVDMPLVDPVGGTWSGIGVIGNSFNPQLAGGVGTYTLTYTVEDDNMCENSETATITVIAPVYVDAGLNDTICIDQGIVQMAGFSPLFGQWSGPGIVDANGGLFDPTIVGAGLHTLKYSKGTGNCYTEDTKNILVVDLIVEAGEDQEACLLDDPFFLDNYTPSGGLWVGTGIIDASSGIFDPATSGVGTHMLTYTFTDPLTGCVRMDNKEVTILSVEEADFNIPDFSCRNEPITFENFSPTGYEYQWSFGLGAGTSTLMNPVHAYTVTGDYTVTLIIINAQGCADTTSQDITIADTPVALFEPSISESCSGDSVLFTNQSFGDSLTYFWTFGDFQTSTAENPGLIVFQQGFYDTTYLVTLTVENICGEHTYQDVILVHPGPSASIGIVPLTECSPLIVEFANASTGGASDFFWDFGNGNTSTDQFPEAEIYFTDSVTVTYPVMMIASNVCGVDTVFTEITVDPASVVASAQMSVDAGCVPLTVDFSNFSTPGATIDWNFGDGNSSSEVEPSHIFTEAGEYTVVQYASSECGYDTIALNIVVHPQPVVSFIHENGICNMQEVAFTNNAENTSGHFWDFGDGNSSTETNPIHSYTTPGSYTVSLTGISQFNQCETIYESEITILELPSANFEPSTTYGCAPLTIDFSNTSSATLFYFWNFGDGNTSIAMNPSHTFEDEGTYAVTLRSTDVYGCYQDTTVFNIIVSPIPMAAFDFEKEESCGLPAIINFENFSEGALDYQWLFGQGSTMTTTAPTFTYTEAGTYEVTMVAFNQFSCSDTTRMTIDIYEDPVAGIEIESTDGCAPLSVKFLNSSSASTDYQWFFGDGSTSTEPSPRHLYETPGDYEVKLVASVNNVCPDTVVFFEPIHVYPMAFANFEATQIENDGTYDIVNLSENADDYFWEFSDGETSTLENPSHRFLNNGVQQIYLEASNDYGCVDDTLISFIPDFVKGLFLPNAFSPEQGIGDVRLFKAKGIGLKEYRLQVFSTYGQQLWESTALDEQGRPSEGWDGIVDNEMMPQDSYVWKCSGIFLDGSAWIGVEEGNKRKVMGSLVLLR
jgi:PKD repeat protein